MPFISSVSGNFGPTGRSRRPFNLATGGNSTADVANYNGTGQLWRVHTFTSSGTFTVLTSLDTFSILIVAGGGNGGGDRGGGGGGGGVIDDNAKILSIASYPITVGGARQDSVAFSLTALKGGNGGSYNGGNGEGGVGVFGSGGGGGGGNARSGGAGTPPQGTNGDGGNSFGGNYGGGRAFSSNITGSSLIYGARGPAGDWGGPNSTPLRGGGGYGGRNNADALGRTDGGPGIVIIAYRIG